MAEFPCEGLEHWIEDRFQCGWSDLETEVFTDYASCYAAGYAAGFVDSTNDLMALIKKARDGFIDINV